MCGIAGRFNFKTGRLVDRGAIVAMCDLIAHRGPDESGVYVEGPVGLGHRRLSVIDLTATGRQPMATPDGGAVVVFNGEIYNFAEVRNDLETRGHRFRGRSDTEVLLTAYREFGVDCLGRLRGMFAFALWDAASRSLFIARDRLGKKPLHYRIDSDGIAFASEAKAFFGEPSFSASPDLRAISHYLSYQYVPAPFSAFEGVSKLSPGSYIVVAENKVTIERYWQLRYSPKRRMTEEDAASELLERLREAVAIRLVSDVPLGAFLSGGIDSSAIVALMAQLSSGRVRTYSIGFEEQEYDELPYARLVADKFGTDHHEFVVRPDATAVVPDLVWHYDEPYADESAIPTYYLAQLTRQHVTVALNGDGGDESFSGYSRYGAIAAGEPIDGLPEPLRRFGAELMGRWPESSARGTLISKAQRAVRRAGLSPHTRYAHRVMHFTPDMKRALCTSALSEIVACHDSTKLALDGLRNSGAENFIDAMMAIDVSHYLPDCLLVKVDIATMAHGLEGRSPLLDHELVEFAASLPADLKRRGRDGKYLFKRVVRDLLPAEVLQRRKMGFGVPLDHWFRSSLHEMAHDVLLTGAATRRGLFNPSYVSSMLEEHRRGTASWKDQIWNLLMLEYWFRTFIDRRPVDVSTGKRVDVATRTAQTDATFSHPA